MMDILKKVFRKTEKLPKLTVELVPETSFYHNVRGLVAKQLWDWLRTRQYKLAGYRCQICGGKGDRWPVECHEIWEYNDKTHVQKLVGLIALCPACHLAKHAGFANTQGRGWEVTKQLVKVNDWTVQQTERYLEKAFNQWYERSHYAWKLDLSWLDTLLQEIPSTLPSVPPEEME